MTIVAYHPPKKKKIKDYRKSKGCHFSAKCDVCEDKFYPKRSTAKYCSDTCNQAAARKRKSKK